MKQLDLQRRWVPYLFVLLGAVPACDTKKADATTAASVAVVASSPIAAAQVSDSRRSAKVTNIVFVTKEHPCECTRKKIDAAEAALKQALGEPASLPVHTLKADVEPEKVEPYRLQKPMMAIPAIYFLDGSNAVVQMLQGEVTPEQVAQALGSPSQAAPAR
jgi:hypothetical protein